MAHTDPAEILMHQDIRSRWVRLRTLLFLRWLAILGQTAAIVVASFYLGLSIALGFCYLAIGASVLSNLVATNVFPENQRLDDRDAMFMLLFDLSQLCFLLFLTGGLNNPFALLILGPVTISATALTLRSTIILGALAVILVSVLAFFHLPLRDAMGTQLELPGLFVAGFWVAIVIGIVFLSVYARRVSSETHRMSQALLATQMALAREQKLTDLGGVVAAAAHELGTPLATIKLVSSELADDLAHHPDWVEDAKLICTQADRCRDILRSMGRAGKDDLHMRSAPLGAIIREAAEPHEHRGIAINYDISAEKDAPPHQPVIWRKPEIVHGLRNLIQNAIDFADQQIWIEARWGNDTIALHIIDDGPGYPVDLLGRLGDPFLRRRTHSTPEKRPGYEGMGLGVFIAKTLLERAGAHVSFANASDDVSRQDGRLYQRGAIAGVVWPKATIGLLDEDTKKPLGQNQPHTAI
jgi:two-component system sensor histidine kinase RegB